MTQPVMKYVVGYCFDPYFEHVVLIEKARPEWQAGKLNGVGGKIEPKETPRRAMVREFQEEAGVYIPAWQHIRTEKFNWWRVGHSGGLERHPTHVYHFATVATRFQWSEITTMTDEQIVKVALPFGLRTRQRVIYNLRYLVPMAKILLQQPRENTPAP